MALENSKKYILIDLGISDFKIIIMKNVTQWLQQRNDKKYDSISVLMQL